MTKALKILKGQRFARKDKNKKNNDSEDPWLLYHCTIQVESKVINNTIIQEPTSGLDSHSAQGLISRLKKYAEQEGKSIVVTVHQPSSRMFHSFSKILLLSRGQVAYYGPTTNIGRFFSTIGLTLLPHYNPADFIREYFLFMKEQTINNMLTSCK